ncbi:hypothetical protein [Candidatus Methanomassiliicoccus intestinalis]|uniref:hypothetical protein n=1 Tax=Candidatus Methanomassiliicoccus intestinalis TaxID=1406512 RepID=UPI0037DD4AE0
MVAILTDTPLEEIMEHAPPRGGYYPEDELLCHGCIRVIRRDDLRKSYLMNFDCSFDQQINALLHTDLDHWYTYTTADEIIPDIDVNLFLFVYWYLTKGKNIVLYHIENMPGFGPETMISNIDIATKNPGMTPKEDYHLVVSDVLYHFSDSQGSAHLHNTAILEQMAKDRCFDEHFSMGRVPQDNMTLTELMKISGNCSMYMTIYDYAEVMSLLSELGGVLTVLDNELWPDYIRPIEMITAYDQYWEWHSRGWRGPPLTRENSKYADCPVRMYCLYCRSSADLLSRICIRDAPVDNNLIGMVALVDTKNVKRS